MGSVSSGALIWMDGLQTGQFDISIRPTSSQVLAQSLIRSILKHGLVNQKHQSASQSRILHFLSNVLRFPAIKFLFLQLLSKLPKKTRDTALSSVVCSRPLICLRFHHILHIIYKSNLASVVSLQRQSFVFCLFVYFFLRLLAPLPSALVWIYLPQADSPLWAVF